EVPTVERALLVFTFCSIATAGAIPLMYSTLGLSIRPRNCRAYADKLSTYLRWPSAYSVSNAKLDFPEPDNPVITTNLLRGITTSICLRLCRYAPLMMIFFFGSIWSKVIVGVLTSNVFNQPIRSSVALQILLFVRLTADFLR